MMMMMMMMMDRINGVPMLQTLGLPRYAHQALSRALKNTPYQAFINAYPRYPDQLHKIVEDHRPFFATVYIYARERERHFG